MRFQLASAVLLAVGLLASLAQAREWKDATGKYTVSGDLVAFSEDKIAIKRDDGKLVAMNRADLSPDDQQFLRTQEERTDDEESDLQNWTLQGGWQISGRIVGYGQRNITIQRRRGNIYVNDRRFDNLPEVLQQLVPQIVSQAEGVEITGKRQLESWAIRQRGEPRTFTVDGVMLELKNGDEYIVPFTMFNESDLSMLRPGWEQWIAAEKDAEARRREDFYLRAQAEAYARDRRMNQRISQMQLLLSAVDAGVTDLWEVQLLPRPGVAAYPQFVVVPARNSRQAIQQALSRNPNFVAGPARRLN